MNQDEIPAPFYKYEKILLVAEDFLGRYNGPLVVLFS